MAIDGGILQGVWLGGAEDLLGVTGQKNLASPQVLLILHLRNPNFQLFPNGHLASVIIRLMSSDGNAERQEKTLTLSDYPIQALSSPVFNHLQSTLCSYQFYLSFPKDMDMHLSTGAARRHLGIWQNAWSVFEVGID